VTASLVHLRKKIGVASAMVMANPAGSSKETSTTPKGWVSQRRIIESFVF